MFTNLQFYFYIKESDKADIKSEFKTERTEYLKTIRKQERQI